jgi:uncharacterized peroxidase-related enzyme
MPRIAKVAAETADPAQRELLDATRRQLGRVPNLYATLAHSPAALRGYLALRDSLLAGVLSERVREQLALLTAQENDCDYCVAAHTMRGGRLLGMSPGELLDTRRARDADPHTAAILRLAADLVEQRGRVGDAALEQARAAGVTDAELAETVAHVALNILSNYFNHLARPDLDFPAAPTLDEPEKRAADMDLIWQHADLLELCDGYTGDDADGTPTATLKDVRIAVQGGYLHIAHPGDPRIQIVSAPGVRRVVYTAAAQTPAA